MEARVECSSGKRVPAFTTGREWIRPVPKGAEYLSSVRVRDRMGGAKFLAVAAITQTCSDWQNSKNARKLCGTVYPPQIRQQEEVGNVVWTNPKGLPGFRSSETEVRRGNLVAVAPMPKRVEHRDLVKRGDGI